MASKYAKEDEEDAVQGLIGSAKQAIQTPFRIAFSRPARRAYLTSLLLVLGAASLLGLAITAYILFYWSYVPRIGFERTLHLQFDDVSPSAAVGDGSNPGRGVTFSPHPYAIATLTPDIVSAQRYDVTVELTLPRTRANRDAGNFMVEASMYAAENAVVDAVKEGLLQEPGRAEADRRLAVSRRPATLRYRSAAVDALCRLTELPWYLLRVRDEADTLTVALFDGLEFARGWRNLPATLRLDIQGTRRLHIYSAKAVFRARFRGLRWLMYNHRIVSAVIFIATFWSTELLFAGLAWAALSLVFAPHAPEAKAEGEGLPDGDVKAELDDETTPALSDTERTFPTLSMQTPLRYESAQIKQEYDDDAVLLPDPGARPTEADDEDEDADTFHDSGLGTSLESGGGRRDSVRRRKSRTGRDDDW